MNGSEHHEGVRPCAAIGLPGEQSQRSLAHHLGRIRRVACQEDKRKAAQRVPRSGETGRRPVQVQTAPVVALRLRIGSFLDRQLTKMFVHLRQAPLMRQSLVDTLRAPGVFERLSEPPRGRR